MHESDNISPKGIDMDSNDIPHARIGVVHFYFKTFYIIVRLIVV